MANCFLDQVLEFSQKSLWKHQNQVIHLFILFLSENYETFLSVIFVKCTEFILIFVQLF